MEIIGQESTGYSNVTIVSMHKAVSILPEKFYAPIHVRKILTRQS